MSKILQFPSRTKNIEAYTDTEQRLAQRLNASFTSVKMGLNSVDYTIKAYIGDASTLNETWYKLAHVMLLAKADRVIPE